MGRILLSLFLLQLSVQLNAQSFSNKGTDFWVAYGYHLRMNTTQSNNSQEMVLYFATDQLTHITITTGTGYSQVITSPATPAVVTSNPLPKSGTQDLTLRSETTIGVNKGIHITSDKPMVAYAHIYNQSISGATILFPTNTLGKTYYSINYTQTSNEDESNCWFYVIATEPGTTLVRITPSAPTINHPAGVPFLVSLTEGQVFNIMGQLNGGGSSAFSGVDLTGSKIESISSGGTACKKIAVFSGSGKINITCNSSSQNSADNYMVQAFPRAAWGKHFLTVPTKVLVNNFFRICISETNTNVTVNGAPITATLTNGFYYEISANTPQKIDADKPITVAQYITTRGSCGNPNTTNGDPEVIYLSPIEQNIEKVIWNATDQSNINEQYINVVIPNTGTAISSFKLDGSVVPFSEFTVHPRDSRFSYLSKAITTTGTHIIASDSSFNAIAYGYGSAESYGYNAGTNIRDLEIQIDTVNQLGDTINGLPTKICANTPFYLKVKYPFAADSINFNFGTFFPQEFYPSPTVSMDSLLDSTYFDAVIGKTMYVYKVPHTFSYNLPNTSPGYPLTITAYNPNIQVIECGSNSFAISKDMNIIVYGPPPNPSLFKSHTGCIVDPVQFNDISAYPTDSIPLRFSWDFGDGLRSNLRNPQHSYANSGTYTVKLSTISAYGCLSDTVSNTVVVTQKPLSTYTLSTPICFGSPVKFTPTSTMANPDTIKKWYWNFGDGRDTIINYPNTGIVQHFYLDSITFPSSLVLETNSGCKSTLLQTDVLVNPKPFAGFIIPGVCLIDPFLAFAQFTDTSKFPTVSTVRNWLWSFGDATPNSTLQNPQHNYTAIGDYPVKLIVSNQTGCKDSVTNTVTIGGAIPRPEFLFVNSPDSICEKDTIYIKNTSTIAIGRINKSIIYWNRVNSNIDTTLDNDVVDGEIYKHTYPVLRLERQYEVKMVSYSGGCVDSTIGKIVTVRPIPEAAFSADKYRICQGDYIVFTDQSKPVDGNLSHWYWDFGNGDSSMLQNPVYRYPDADTFNVHFYVRNEGGCRSDTFDKQVIVNPYPIVHAGPDLYLLDGNQDTLHASFDYPGSFSQVQTRWTITKRLPFSSTSPPANLYLSSPFSLNPVFTPPVASLDNVYEITYSFQATGVGGCPAKDEVKVFILRVPDIPNTFSPNHDGKNDYWEIKNLYLYPDAKVKVFTRAGEIVFQSDGYKTAWDGTKNGKPLPVDTYYYIIQPQNGRQPFTGFVTILK